VILKEVRVNQYVLSSVGLAIQDAERLLERGKLWSQGKITEEQNGTGWFSGALQEAKWAAGSAQGLCEGAGIVHGTIRNIAEAFHNPKLRVVETSARLVCPDPAKVTLDPAAAAAQWNEQASEVLRFEQQYADTCMILYGPERWPLPQLVNTLAGKEPTTEHVLNRTKGITP